MRDESNIYPENYHIIPSEMRTDEWWDGWWRQREQEKLNENKGWVKGNHCIQENYLVRVRNTNNRIWFDQEWRGGSSQEGINYLDQNIDTFNSSLKYPSETVLEKMNDNTYKLELYAEDYRTLLETITLNVYDEPL